MISVLFKHKGRHASIIMLTSGIMIMLSLLLAACGSGGSSTPSTSSNSTTSTATSPTGLITPGVLTIGSDTTYPPQEFIDSTTKNSWWF